MPDPEATEATPGEGEPEAPAPHADPDYGHPTDNPMADQDDDD